MSARHSPRPPISLDAHVRVPDTVLSQELAGEAVLLHLETGTYFGLDPIGARIWQLLKAGRSLQAISHTLLEEYVVEREALERDVLRLVQALSEEGLLEHD